MKEIFMKTENFGFSVWEKEDFEKMLSLYSEKEISRYITAGGVFSKEQIEERFSRELENLEKYGVQYWPVVDLKNGELMGCCGFRPKGGRWQYECGIHLKSAYHGTGAAREIMTKALEYGFEKLGQTAFFAGCNPNNLKSKGFMKKLGFEYIGDEYYAPTGLMHPSFEIKKEKLI